MTLQDIKSLMMQIKSFYPRFESVEKHGGEFEINETIAVNWHKKIGWMDIQDAMQLLDRWINSENGSKPPTISWWTRNGRNPEKATHSTMRFDRRNTLCIWQPDPDGKTYEIPLKQDRDGTFYDADGRIYAIR